MAKKFRKKIFQERRKLTKLYSEKKMKKTLQYIICIYTPCVSKDKNMGYLKIISIMAENTKVVQMKTHKQIWYFWITKSVSYATPICCSPNEGRNSQIH